MHKLLEENWNLCVWEYNASFHVCEDLHFEKSPHTCKMPNFVIITEEEPCIPVVACFVIGSKNLSHDKRD